MNENLIREIFEYLKKTGELIASEGYKMAYKQALIEGYKSLILGLLLLSALFLVFRFARKVYRTEVKETGDGTGTLTISSIIVILSLGFGIGYIFDALNFLLNPELAAIKILMSLVK